ncbi:hypothetical protein JHK85_050382 [Glycine max]|nr:hypothetical protein JHK85_050382 [Glycine max]
MELEERFEDFILKLRLQLRAARGTTIKVAFQQGQSKENLVCYFLHGEVDQMVIHSASDLRPPAILCGDYFYNYFTCGLDILFDGQEILGDCGRVAIQTQGSASNPFGSTLVYGYQNIAFEQLPLTRPNSPKLSQRRSCGDAAGISPEISTRGRRSVGNNHKHGSLLPPKNRIGENEISFLTKGEDPYDDAVIHKLFHPNLKLLLVTEGCRGLQILYQGGVEEYLWDPLLHIKHLQSVFPVVCKAMGRVQLVLDSCV